MEDFNLLSYIYIEYTLAILFVTEVLKELIPKPKNKFWAHPKWMTAVVGILLGIAEHTYMSSTETGVEYSKMILSLGSAVIFYDYFWKLVKDGWTLLLNKMKKANKEALKPNDDEEKPE